MWKMEEKICDYQDYKDEVEIPDLDTEPITFKEDRNMDFHWEHLSECCIHVL